MIFNILIQWTKLKFLKSWKKFKSSQMKFRNVLVVNQKNFSLRCDDVGTVATKTQKGF